MASQQIVTIPYSPRPEQRAMHAGMQTHRFGVAVCHRRLGKSVWAVNQLQRGALMCKKERPRFGYIGPTFRMGKATVFDYMKHFSRPIPGVVPNESELRIDYPNGGQIRIYGGDDPDSLRGLYFDGIVVDEYGLHNGEIFTSVLRPALADRGGWAMFLGTPNGKNQFYDILKVAQNDPATWYSCVYKASQTHIIPEEELVAARAVMSQDEYDQEFECSFEASVKGAIYGAELAQVRAQGRVCNVPVDPILPVDTAWDLAGGGSSGADSTAIWFTQSVRGGEVRVVDYYEAQGEGMPHFAKVLKDKGYAYGVHVAPFDIEVKEIGSGRTRKESARLLGIKFRICPKVSFEDGIHAVRMLLPRCYFDAKRCDLGLEALASYRRDYNQRIQTFKSSPVHDWSSHSADAFRYLSVSQRDPTQPASSRRQKIQAEGPNGWMS